MAQTVVGPDAPCEQAGRDAERDYALPVGLLGAIGKVESGRWDPALGRVVPSPWAIDADGRPYLSDNKASALQMTHALQDSGVRNIDVGCFQINLQSHPAAFTDLEQAFDPAANAQYAARFLASLHARLGNWQDAVAAYHSATPALNDLGIARDLQGRHADAQTAYRQALGINPEMSAAQVNLALSLAMSGQSRDAVQLLRPLADRPGATQQTRHDLAAVLTMNGDRTAAAEILSKDLPPAQVQEALNAFASAQPNAAAAMMGAAPTPAPERSAMAPTAGSVMVQLAGPVPSRDAAQVKWDRLAKEMPNELGSRAPIIEEVEEHGHSVWRVRTSGFADGTAANSFCDRVRMTGTSCTIIQ